MEEHFIIYNAKRSSGYYPIRAKSRQHARDIAIYMWGNPVVRLIKITPAYEDQLTIKYIVPTINLDRELDDLVINLGGSQS